MELRVCVAPALGGRTGWLLRPRENTENPKYFWSQSSNQSEARGPTASWPWRRLHRNYVETLIVHAVVLSFHRRPADLFHSAAAGNNSERRAHTRRSFTHTFPLACTLLTSSPPRRYFHQRTSLRRNIATFDPSDGAQRLQPRRRDVTVYSTALSEEICDKRRRSDVSVLDLHLPAERGPWDLIM